MIEVRKSDVVQGLADNLSNLGQVAGGISRDLYEADRVAQVNKGLTTYERGFDAYQDEVTKQSFDVPVEGGGAEGTGLTATKAFGEADFATVAAGFDSFVEAQLEYVNKNVTNRDARTELIAHLDAKAVQERGKLKGTWATHAERYAKKSLDELYTSTMAANIPWEEKVGRLENRTDEMVRSGWLWPDEAEGVVQDATNEAQYSYAKSGALEAIRDSFLVGEDGDPERLPKSAEAGLAWVRENTPFYDGNPDMREKIFDEVKREWDEFTTDADAEKDLLFGDLHIGADTIDKVDKALDILAKTMYYDGNQKYTWETRFERTRATLLNLIELPEDSLAALKKAQTAYADQLRAELNIGLAAAENPKELWKMVEDAYYRYTEDEDTGEYVHSPWISGADVESFRKLLNAGADPVLADGITFIRAKIKDPEQELSIITDLRAWYRNHPEADIEDIEKAAKNLVDPVKLRNLEKHSREGWAVLFGDKRVKDEYEELYDDIISGDYVGLTDLRKKHLDTLNAYSLFSAQREFPGRDIISVSTDYLNDYGGGHGAPIMAAADGTPYAFKLEDKQLVLYRLAKHRDGSTWTWEEVKPPPEPTPEPVPIPEPVEPEKELEKATEDAGERNVKLGAEEPESGYNLDDYEDLGNGRWKIKGGNLVSREIGSELDALKEAEAIKYDPANFDLADYSFVGRGIWRAADGNVVKDAKINTILNKKKLEAEK